MKNNKKIILVFLLIGLLMINFSSACSNNYHYQPYDDSYENDFNSMDTNDGVIFVVYDDNYYGEDVYSKENEDRYPAYDYRFGYTSRLQEDYYYNSIRLNNFNDRRNDYYPRENFMNWLFDGEDDRVVYQTRPQYYYTYSDYMEEYEKHECYTYPPKDKLFYVECP